MITSIIIWLLAVTIAITVHEFAHAFASDRLGDPTARLAGRLSLNPLDHYDPIGTTMLIASAIFFGFPIGWAKPVPFDPYNLANPKRDSLIIALAGPLMNFIASILVVLFSYITNTESVLRYAVNIPSDLYSAFIAGQIPPVQYFMLSLGAAIVIVNIALAIFNLIPVHPLDGAKVLLGLLPHDLALEYNFVMQRFGTLLLLFLIFPISGTSPITALINPVIQFFLKLLVP